jgi:hypothetical protein
MSAYLLYVLLATAQHQAWPIFSTIVLALVLPLTAITLGRRGGARLDRSWEKNATGISPY